MEVIKNIFKTKGTRYIHLKSIWLFLNNKFLLLQRMHEIMQVFYWHLPFVTLSSKNMCHKAFNNIPL